MAALAKALRAEATRARAVEGPTWDPSKFCFAEQLEVLVYAGGPCSLCTTRRAGKTWTIIALLLNGVLTTGRDALYLSQTQDSAMAIIWRDLCDEAAKHGGKPTESDCVIRFPSGASIYIGGLVDKRMGPRLGRGLCLSIVCVDECQSIAGEVLRRFVEADVTPALTGKDGTDNGRLVLAGTPNEFLSGFWFRFVHNTMFKSFAWDGTANPHMRENFAKLRAEKVAAYGLNDPDVQREWFGRWVASSSKLVAPSFKRDFNEYDQLPANDNAANVSAGIDLGFGKDPTAIVLVASYRNTPGYWIVFEWSKLNPSFDDIEAVLLDLASRWSISTMWIDPANGGKGFADTYAVRHGWPIKSAQKYQKESRLKLMDSLLASGRLKAPRDGQFVAEATTVIWDPVEFEKEKKVVAKETPNDTMDAVQYALCDDDLLASEGRESPGVNSRDLRSMDPHLVAELLQLQLDAMDPFKDPLDQVA